MPFTSGTSRRIACWMRRLLSMLASMPIDGSDSSCMMMSPSSIVGMKVLPVPRYAPTATTSSATDTAATIRPCASARWSSGV